MFACNMRDGARMCHGLVHYMHTHNHVNRHVPFPEGVLRFLYYKTSHILQPQLQENQQFTF